MSQGTQMTEVLYHREGDTFNPQPPAGSPWHPSLLHGGAVAALLGLLAEEQVSSWSDFRINRITMNLIRPVPMAPLVTRARLERDGQRMKVVQVEVLAGDKPVARAEAIAQRIGQVELPDYAPRPAAAPQGPQGMPDFSIQKMLDDKGLNIPEGFHTRVQVRALTPWVEQGKGTCWLALPLTVLEGVALTPFVRAAMISDLGNGVGQLHFGKGRGTINADITLALFRYPAGEWLCLDSEAQVQDTGLGIVHSQLFDQSGACGYVLQTVQPNAEFRGS